jgi:hypothetical protein
MVSESGLIVAIDNKIVGIEKDAANDIFDNYIRSTRGNVLKGINEK